MDDLASEPGTLETHQIEWNPLDLLGVLSRVGFEPAPRLCLELPVAEA